MKEKELNKYKQVIWLQDEVIYWAKELLKLHYKIKSKQAEDLLDKIINLYYEELEKRDLLDDNKN